MNILIMLAITVVLGVLCFGIGSLIGKAVGKSQKKKDDARKNRGAHV